MSAKIKLVLYMLTLLVIQIQTGTADYTADDVATWKPWDWFKLVIAIFGSLALSARMFFDQSVAREQAAKFQIPSTAPGTVGTPTPVATQPADTTVKV